MANTAHDEQIGRGTTEQELTGRLSQVSWGALFVGLVLAVSVQILLTLLGIGIGFAVIDPSSGFGGIGAWGIGTYLYVVLVQIVALFIGGYAAARLSRARTGVSAMFHGATVWALALLVSVWLGTTTAGLAASGLSAAVSGIGKATGQAVSAVIPDNLGDISLPDISMEDLPAPIRETLRENDITPSDLQRELQQAFRQVFTEREQQQVIDDLQQAAQTILRNPAAAAEESEQTVNEIYDTVLSDQDLQQMQQTLQQRLNLSDQEMQEITDSVDESVDEMREEAGRALEDLRQQAVSTAETVTDQIASIAFWMFVSSLLGLIAAVVGSNMGEKGRVTR